MGDIIEKNYKTVGGKSLVNTVKDCSKKKKK